MPAFARFESPPSRSVFGGSAWVALVAAASGVFLTSLDITVNVALPEIADSFGAEAATVQWIIILYVGASASMQLALGAAADAAGLKRMYVFGLAAYTVAVVAIGAADDLGVVFALRTLQAVGNGLLMALSPALVTRAFPPEFRGRALGVMAALGTLGMVVGSLGGGALVDAFGWRAIFLARAPICAAAIAFAVVFLRAPNDSRARGGLDARGAAAQFVGVGSLILALSLGGRIGWADWRVAALGIASAVGLWAFFAVERRSARPLLRLSETGGGGLPTGLAVALAVTALAYLGTFVNWFILPFFVVDGMGASASAWGALLLLMTLATALSAPLGGWLSDRWRPAYAMSGALAVGCAALAWMSSLDTQSEIWEVAVGLLATGAATGLFQSASANLIMGAMPRERLGAGGGAMGLARGLGTALSVALMGAAFAALESARASEGEAAFALAFQDTYRIAALICAGALAASLALWRRA